MLNPFYWYGFIWSFVLILYSLNISDLCQPLDAGLLIFLISSIFISFLLGNIFKKNFQFKPKALEKHKSAKPTIIIFILYSLNFIYANDIPLFDSIFNDKVTYRDFNAIPFFGVMITIVAELYSVYLCVQLIYNPSRKMLLEAGSMILLGILQLNRNYLLVCGIALIVTYLNTHKIKMRYYGLGVLIILTFCYLMGGLGNVRSLSSWNDSSYIEHLAMINGNYPEFIPKEFIWPYIYIVCPLANLNYNISNMQLDNSFTNFLICFLPDFIEKRISSSFSADTPLLVSYFTVSTTYATTYKYGDWLGIIITQIIIFGESIAFSEVIRRNKDKLKKHKMLMVIIIFQLYFIGMTFFSNIFRFSGSILPLIFGTIILYLPKIKIKGKKQNF